MKRNRRARKGQRKVMGYYLQERHAVVLIRGGLVLGCGLVMVAVFCI